MNNSNFMDKQIMGLSGTPDGGGGGEFFDLINRQEDQRDNGEFFDLINRQEDQRDNGGVLKKEEIIPSYDFQTMRPAPSPSTSFVDDASKPSRFSPEPHVGESTLGPEFKLAQHYGASVDDVESTVKKYADILLHALEVMDSRLSQLESRTCILENSVDELKVSNENNYETTDGNLRKLDSFMREAHTVVQLLQERQEFTEAHIELTKLQRSIKADYDQSESLQAKPDSQQLVQQAPQFSAFAPSLPPALPLPASTVPPPPLLPQQNQTPVPFASQLSLQPQMYSIPSLPQEPSFSKPLPQVPQFTPPTGLPTEPTHQQQQYQMPQSQAQNHQALPQSHHCQSSPQVPQYSQPIQLEETKSYVPPSHPYPSSIRQPCPPSEASAGPALLHHYYGTNPPVYELPPTSRPSSGSLSIPSSYGAPGFSEPYHYGTLPSYNIKPSSFSSVPPTSVGSGSYQHLPVAKILPQAVPAGPSSSGGGPTGNRVPIDDVVDKVATMGFSRDQVRTTVRNLTENGQSVDLNLVLDKLMNGGQNQPAKGWLGR